MNNNLGVIIKSKRESLGLSVREFAKLCNINHTDVSKLEKNKIQKPSIKTLISMSNVLNCNLLALYLEDNEHYLYYQPIIDSCSGLSKRQLTEVLTYINQLKDRGTL